MQRRTLAFATLSLAISTGPLRGESSPADAIGPFVDDTTIAIVRLDAAGVDMGAVEKIIVKSFGPAGDTKHGQRFIESIRRQCATGAAKLGALVKAGGRDLFFVIDAAGLSPDSLFAVAPKSGRADGKALAEALTDLIPLESARQIGQAVVAGTPATLDRLAALEPVPPAHLKKAFEAAGDATLQMIVIPSADTRRVVEELSPALPAELGGGPTAAFTRGVQWIAASINGPPKLSARLTVQTPDADHAQKLHAAVKGALAAVKKLEPAREGFPEWEQIITSLTPSLENDRLTLKLDKERAEHLIVDVIGSAMQKARRNAQRMLDATQARGIHLQCVRFAQGNTQNFPPDIATLCKAKYLPAEFVLSPISGKRLPDGFNQWPIEKRMKWVNENSSYVLLPGLKADSDSQKIAVFTKIQDSDGTKISVCWNDNHVTVEYIAKARKLILAQTGKTLEQWSGVEQPDPK